MINLTFGEQVKIILSRKGMTIKELAELIEQHTGKSMSRQNLTQRLGRDNFQEKDMRLIAEILGCKFQLSIMEMDPDAKPVVKKEKPKTEVQEGKTEEEVPTLEREVTVGELLDMCTSETEMTDEKEEVIDINSIEESKERELLRKGVMGYFRKQVTPQAESKKKKDSVLGEVNPYTGKEYKTNSVRMHPKRIGYVQVYDQEMHKWTDMTEWAFLGYQERKKRLLGKDYEPPIYLD